MILMSVTCRRRSLRGAHAPRPRELRTTRPTAPAPREMSSRYRAPRAAEPPGRTPRQYTEARSRRLRRARLGVDDDCLHPRVAQHGERLHWRSLIGYDRMNAGERTNDQAPSLGEF